MPNFKYPSAYLGDIHNSSSNDEICSFITKSFLIWTSREKKKKCLDYQMTPTGRKCFHHYKFICWKTGKWLPDFEMRTVQHSFINTLLHAHWWKHRSRTAQKSKQPLQHHSMMRCGRAPPLPNTPVISSTVAHELTSPRMERDEGTVSVYRKLGTTRLRAKEMAQRQGTKEGKEDTSNVWIKSPKRYSARLCHIADGGWSSYHHREAKKLKLYSVSYTACNAAKAMRLFALATSTPEK